MIMRHNVPTTSIILCDIFHCHIAIQRRVVNPIVSGFIPYDVGSVEAIFKMGKCIVLLVILDGHLPAAI